MSSSNKAATPLISRGGFVILGVVATVAGLGAYVIADRMLVKEAHGAPTPAVPAPQAEVGKRAGATSTPKAAQFAQVMVEASNRYGAEHGKAARFAAADCVQASPGHYMCSYAVVRPGRPAECHIMQANWTPWDASTFTVTLGSRVARCGTLREALASLK